MSGERDIILGQLVEIIATPNCDPHDLVIAYAAAWGTVIDLCPDDYKAMQFEQGKAKVEYKKFKDAANLLEAAAQLRALQQLRKKPGR